MSNQSTDSPTSYIVNYLVVRPKTDRYRPVFITAWILSIFGLGVLLALSPITTHLEDPYRKLPHIYDRFQIPHHNIPFLYKLSLHVYLPFNSGISFAERNFSIDGYVEILFHCKVPSQKLLLHSHLLKVHHVFLKSLEGDASEIVEVEKFYHNNAQQVLHIDTRTHFVKGVDYILYVNYTQKSGIYAAPYRSPEGARWMAATHLQSMEARTVLPCFDVPEIKAVFQATITHPFGTNAVSNTKELEVVSDSLWTTTKFEPTPLMSTYLFALCISDFPFAEVYSKDNVRIRVYTEESKVNDTGVAIDIVPKLLDFYEEYFGMKYPLSKLDIFSVPMMRVAAMENWGLITCTQKFVVYNSKVYTVSERRQVTDLLSHEVSHMWFGNLVTMKWWNNLWLNEGFATMIGMKVADYLENATIRNDEVALDNNARTYRQDQIDDVSVPVSIREGIRFNPEKQFNQITYRKAASLIRMLEKIVGAENFKNGLRLFLNTFQYKNADHTDLLEALMRVHDESSTDTHLSDQNFTLTQMMETWIYQKGYPQLTVENVSPGQWRISQQKFEYKIYGMPAREKKKSLSQHQQWKIPLFIDENSAQVHWITENSTLTVNHSDRHVVDSQGFVYGRILYDEEQYTKITQAIFADINTIPVPTRVRLVDDSFTFAEVGKLSYGTVFRLMLYIQNETCFTPLSIAGAHLEYITGNLMGHPQYELLQAYTIRLLAPLFHRFIADPISPTNMSLYQDTIREQVFSRLTIYGYEPCIEYTRKMFERLRFTCEDQLLSNENCNEIPTYLRMPVYAASIMYGQQEDFDFLYTKWNEEIYNAEKDRIWSGMAASRHKEHIHKLFDDVMFIHAQREDLRARCIDYSKYYHKENHFKRFVEENAERIFKRYHKIDRVIHIILRCIAKSVHTQEELESFAEIERRSSKSMAHPGQPDYLSRLRSQFQWREVFAPIIFGNLSLILNENHNHNSIV